jgi:hypothetical protein
MTLLAAEQILSGMISLIKRRERASFRDPFHQISFVFLYLGVKWRSPGAAPSGTGGDAD